jgi:hypothetical protein
LKILTLADGGIGGTEKAATIYASGLKKLGHEVTFSGNPGPRTSSLLQQHIKVLPKARNEHEMRDMIECVNPDVIHQHVPGYPCNNPIYDILDLMDHRPKLVQTNVFGWLSEKRAFEMVDYHLFISRASGSQAFRRAGITLNDEWLNKSSVIMYPMPESMSADPCFRMQFRREHNIPDDTCLCIRVGQPGKSKWTSWETDALIHAHKLGAKVHLVLMQPPNSILHRLQQAIDLKLLTILSATSDFAWLNNLYTAADIMLHASNFGESFGYTIAEGMAAGLPVITRSTPWGDNAQVELVENKLTGYTCATTREMGRRLVELANDITKARAMGESGKHRIHSLSNLEKEISLLEKVMIQVSTGTIQSDVVCRNKDFLDFHKKLPLRENTFSDKKQPFGEYLEWCAYSRYRSLKAKARVLLTHR